MTTPIDHTKVRRAASKVGGKLERERRVRVGRQRGFLYDDDDLGPLCSAGCGTRVVRQLAERGITEHPACVRSSVLQDAAARSWGL